MFPSTTPRRGLPAALLLLAALAGPPAALAQTPALTSRNPAANTHAAPRAGALTATFSQPLDPGTVGGVRVQGALRQGRRAGVATVSGNTLSFQPAAPLLPGERVQVTLPATVRGTNGAAIAPQVYELRAAVSGAGSGLYTAGAVTTTGSANLVARNCLLGDIDNDGDLDVVTWEYTTYTTGSSPGYLLQVLRNQGGTLVAEANVQLPDYTDFGKVPLTDFDGDGDLDLLTYRQNYGNPTTFFSIYPNDGSGNFLAAAPRLIYQTNFPDDPYPADVDGDGDQDLLVNSYDASASTNTLLTYLNDGSGNFVVQGPGVTTTYYGVNYSAGTPSGLGGDLDEDGDVDLLGTSIVGGTTSLLLYRNQGNGTMTSPVPIGPTAGELYPYRVLDLNGDQHLDVAYVKLSGPNGTVLEVFVAPGDGTGNLGPATKLADVRGEFGDVDGDGDPDYVYLDAGRVVHTLLNNGQGSFADTFTLGTSFSEVSELGDFDGDGDLDVLGLVQVPNAFGPLDAQLLLNQSARPVVSSFSPGLAVAGGSITITGDRLAGVSSVTLNGLTLPLTVQSATSLTVTLPAGATTGPLVVTNAYGPTTSGSSLVVRVGVASVSPAPNSSSVGVNNPITATFTEAVTGGLGIKVTGSVRGNLGATVTGGGSSTLSVALGTTPVAGELLTVSLPSSIQSPAGAALLPYAWSFRAGVGGTGTGNFQPGYSTASSGGNGPKFVLAADLNHDGAPDLVALQPDAPDENVLVALNTGTGGTLGTPTPLPVGSNSKALGLADVNGDGHLDLLTTNQTYNYNTSAYSGFLNVRLGNGNGGFAATATSLAAGRSPFSLATGDVNGDGYADVVAADYTAGTLLTFLGSSTGLGSALAGGSVDTGPTDVALADVNNDGQLDVLTAAFFYSGNAANPGRVSVRLGTGQGNFTSAGGGYANVPAQTSSLVVGDLNGDHFADIVSLANTIGGGPANVVQVSLGAGNGSFTTGQTLSPGGTPFGAALGDVDADGDLDVLVANGSRVKVLRNDSGTLTAQPDAVAGSSTQTVTLADLDGDQDLDLVVANFGSGYLTVRLNTPGAPPPPTISGFTPASGGYGTQVTINGTALSGTTGVKFNGAASYAVTVVSNTQVTANVPYGATTGSISVTTPSGTATSATSFTVVLPPSIYSFTPTSGPVGTQITLTGEHLTGVTEVSFNGLVGTNLLVDSDTQLRVTVPAGATTSYLVLTGPGGTSGSQDQFVVTGGMPFIYSFAPTSGPVGTQVSIFGNGFTGFTQVTFNGAAATAVVGTPTDTNVQVLVPAGATTGAITLTTPTGTATSANAFTVTGPPRPANDQCGSVGVPTLACGQQFVQGTTVGATSTGDPTTGTGGLTPSAAAGGVFYQFAGQGELVTVSLCNSTYAPWGARLFVYSGSCGNLTCEAADATSCNNTFPKVTFAALAGTTYTIMVNGAGSSQGSFLIGVSCDLLVSYNQVIPGGTYQNLVIQPQATGTLGGPIVVQSQLQVQPGGTLLTACQPLTGSGSFSLGSGATLGICDAAGLGLPGTGQGAVQLTGPRTLSPEARYLFNGSNPQQTGGGLPAQAQALLLQNAAGLSLSQALAVSQLVRLGSGSLTLGGQYLTLLSGPGGTALIDNAGGQVLGATGQMQRYISPALNPLSGYRHFSAPVSGCPVQQLTTSGYTPKVNGGYNTSATPASVQPFPTIFGYDEARLTTSPAIGYSDFDKGWFSPSALTDLLVPGRGYTVQLPPSALCTFQGTFTTGDVSVPLTHGPQTEAGWHLLGNPYPAPIDWDAPGGFARGTAGGAVYVFESSGPYAGQYRPYVNGAGPAGASLLPAGQSFFVRVPAGSAASTFTFHNAARLTDFSAGQPVLHRPATDPRPRLTLQLEGAAGRPDAAYVYFEAGASPGYDGSFDAPKLLNPGGSSLATELGGQRFAIKGLPVLAAPATVGLALQVPQPGAYVFEAAELANFAPGQTVTLRDALTGSRTVLAPGTRYACTLAGTEAPGRFWLDFGPVAPLSAATAAATAEWQVYPNPSPDGHLRLHLPLTAAPAAAAPAQAELRDALGRVVRRWPLPRPTQLLLTGELDASGLPAGVYHLHLQVGEQTAVRRLVLGQ